MTMAEEEAARLVRAVLGKLVEVLPEGSVRTGVQDALEEADELVPPWDGGEPSEDPVPLMWVYVAPDDWVQGGDGKFYRVTKTVVRDGKVLVSILVNGKEGTYPREPGVKVPAKRGPQGMAVAVFLMAGFDVQVVNGEGASA